MDLILYGGRIATMDAATPQVQAVAIQAGRIAATGESHTVLALKKPHTRCINLAGARVVPGFNDSHLHMLYTAFFAGACNLSGCTGARQLPAILRRHIEEKNHPAQRWVVGYGWNQEHFSGKTFPTRHLLDEVGGGHPIVIFRACLHIAVVNTAALGLLRQKAPAAQLPAECCDWENGVFRETAAFWLMEELRPQTQAEVEQLLAAAGDATRRVGITSAHSDDYGFAKTPRQVAAAYGRLAQKGQPLFRCHQQCLLPQTGALNDFLRESGEWAVPGCENWYTLGPVKLLADGSLGARTALLGAPYQDDKTTRGLATYTKEELDTLVHTAHAAGHPVAVHAIGDGAVQMALNSIEAAQNALPAQKLRHGIVHCQITTMAQLQRFARLGVLAYVQPIFLHADIPLVESRVGKQLAATSYSFKTMLDLGIAVSFGTDSPVESLNPLANICAAACRTVPGGTPEESFLPAQRLSIQQAVHAYTVGSAFAEGKEHCKGRIAPGQLADLAVLSRDIFTIPAEEADTAQVDMTILDGRVVWER